MSERSNVVQVGANRSQITSEKWWEGAFNTALHVINNEVMAAVSGHCQGNGQSDISVIRAGLLLRQ